MTTTSSTTSATAAVTQSATATLLTSLGTGSGVDTTSLVASLVQAQFAARTDALASRTSALTTQISDAGSLKSGITNFATALATLVKGGTLMTQPTSSNTNVLTATATGTGNIASLSSSVTVEGIATAQGAVTGNFAGKTATVGTGTLTLQLGAATYANGAMTGFTAGSAAPVSIAITDADSTLDKVAAKINAAGAGVTASIITNADGTARLSIRGATGTDQAFTLTATEGDTPGLSALNVGVGQSATAITTAAANARLTVDGVAVERASNSIDDLIAGVKLNLVGVSTSAVSLTATRPTTAITQAATDFVDTYNSFLSQLKTATAAIGGSLRADTAAKAMQTSLARLTSTALASSTTAGAPTTLGAIGIMTKRDGTLEVNADTLSKALASYPDAVEALFATAGSGTSGNGLSAALTAISDAASSATSGLGASVTTYTSQKDDVAVQQSDLADDESRMSDRLTKQFTSMNSRVSAYKSIQSFLTQQVDMWTKSDS